MTSERSQAESAYARTLLPLARMWRHVADRALSEFGLSASGGWALVQVGRLGDDVRQTDLAAELDVSAASLVRVVDQLVAAQLVDRQRDEVDARVSRVRLTERGHALVEKIEAAFEALRHETLADIADDDLATALRVAEQLESRFSRRRPR
ncbi:MarR family transcriptional regulator [Sphingomonas sp. RB3P16]|uniref:MarR family winged helix-turn-helix transcriptional regulator n=1 Tax=Parasphingomonas frigoris TaxID=3096163 RepID=UPI002FC8FF92